MLYLLKKLKKQPHSETIELYNGTLEIKNLVEVKLPKAKENLEKAK